MAVLGGRSRFSRAQKGSGSRTVYRRHRREEILIRPTVLDNAYRNSSSRVSSLSNDLGGRAVAFSLLLFPFPTRSISLRFAFLFPLSRLRSSFPSLIRPSSPSSPSSFHRQFLSGNEGTVLASIIPTSILPWPRWKNPASSLLVHEDEPFPSPLPPPRRSHDISARPCSAGISLSFSLSLLLLPPSPTAFFSIFFETLLLRGGQPLFLSRCRGRRVQGRGDPRSPRSAVLDFQCPSTNGSEGWNGSRWTLDGYTQRERELGIGTPEPGNGIYCGELYAFLSLSLCCFFYSSFFSTILPLSFSIFRFSFLVPLSLSL